MIEAESTQLTPMMAQWVACKKAAPQAILLFRLGDFYEAFYEDAHLMSKELDLTLTKRQDVPMSGIPFHTSDGYVDRLVAKGYRVAIAEQVEDARKATGLVKREIVRVVTPGTLMDSGLLADSKNNYFAALYETGAKFGLAFLDLSTGEFLSSSFADSESLANELYRLQPAEILASQKFSQRHEVLLAEWQQNFPFLLTTQEEWQFESGQMQDVLLEHFNVITLEPFGLENQPNATIAAGALLRYLKDGLNLPINHIQSIRHYSSSQYMLLDRMTQRNLELTRSLQDGSRRNTLLEVLDHTSTPMGARLLQHWIKQPLIQLNLIKQRQMVVSAFLNHASIADKLHAVLGHVKDLERLMMKVSAGYATPRDVAALCHSYAHMSEIKELLGQLQDPAVEHHAKEIDPLPAMVQMISSALVESPPLRIGEGRVFREGYLAELDELLSLLHHGKDWMAQYQTKLKEETGIKTLKVGYNKLSGYFIEVSRGQADNMPVTFIRRQTLANAERYITPELKAYESKVLSAEERIQSIESELFLQLRQSVSTFATSVLQTAQTLARLDCLNAFALAAKQNQYVCPEVTEEESIRITEGRHPVIEISCKKEKFIPNDTFLDTKSEQLLLITGPNMAGKSTFLRQTALITIMAQIGSFVPARAASIGLVDKVFTRIGASDDLSKGHSTFMVEMTETASILHQATARSLVILDEIGRGTSTYDGISIAWSVAEYLLVTEGKQAKTLFATHYWELTKLEGQFERAANYRVAVHEAEDRVTFLRKIVRGGTDKSYGIHVARLAGMPTEVISRAKTILTHLEENANRKSVFEPGSLRKSTPAKMKVPQTDYQLRFL